MKGALVVAVVGALVAAGPARQQSPAPSGLVRAGQYRVGGGDAAPAAPGGPVFDVGPFPLSPLELPAGEGREATVAMCSVCHSLRYITMQPPLPPDTWRAEVRKMIEVHGASIPEPAAGSITRYLQEHFSAAAH